MWNRFTNWLYNREKVKREHNKIRTEQKSLDNESVPFFKLTTAGVLEEDALLKSEKLMKTDMEWNRAFIAALTAQGFEGESEEEVVNQFLSQLFLVNYLEIHAIDMAEFEAIVNQFKEPGVYAQRRPNIESLPNGHKLAT
jgi:hypothetical protein